MLKERLKSLVEWIGQNYPEASGIYYCDTGPVMDKAWAHKSGLGWIGKHSNLITRELGSWVFLAELVLNLDLESDAGEPELLWHLSPLPRRLSYARNCCALCCGRTSLHLIFDDRASRSYSQGVAAHDRLAHFWL